MLDDRYYSDWDRWFAEEHDGTPVEWTVCEVTIPGKDMDHESFCATRGPGEYKVPGHSVGLPDEQHEVIHRIEASSALEAMQKYYDKMEYGTYKPHPDWDVEEGRWRK